MTATLETPSALELETRILTAYVRLSDTTHSPDVPIARIYERVGGGLTAFHDALREACYNHDAVPTAGEPAFADEKTLSRALRIDGETFLNIKFLPRAAGNRPPKQKPPPPLTRTRAPPTWKPSSKPTAWKPWWKRSPTAATTKPTPPSRKPPPKPRRSPATPP